MSQTKANQGQGPSGEHQPEGTSPRFDFGRRPDGETQGLCVGERRAWKRRAPASVMPLVHFASYPDSSISLQGGRLLGSLRTEANSCCFDGEPRAFTSERNMDVPAAEVESREALKTPFGYRVRASLLQSHPQGSMPPFISPNYAALANLRLKPRAP